MLSPLSSPDASPRPAAESTTENSESIHSLSQSTLSRTCQGMCTPTESPTFSSSNLATNGSNSNQTLTTMDPVSESSTVAAGSGIPDTLQSMVTRSDESNKLKERMDLDEPHQIGSSHPAKNAISNAKSNKRESGNDESSKAGTSRSTKRPKKKARPYDGDLDEKNIIPDTDDLCGMKMTRAKKLSIEKKVETTSDNVNESHTAQSSNTEAIDAAASQNNTRITSGGQRKAAMEHLAGLPSHQKGSTKRIGIKKTSTDKTTIEKVPSEDRLKMMEATVVRSPTEAQERDYSAKFQPKQYNSRHLYTLIRAKKRDGKWQLKVIKKQKRRVPVGDAQYVWLQSQPKSVRDKATKMDREGTSDPFGTFLEKTKGILHDGTKVEDSVPVQYMSQFIKDRHTPIPEDERRRKKMNKTYTFKTYFPSSALVQRCPNLIYDGTELNVEFIETVLETKSKESFELKAKIDEAIKIQMMKKEEAAEVARVAKAAEAVARGISVASVASSPASSEEYIRVGLECEMILDDK